MSDTSEAVTALLDGELRSSAEASAAETLAAIKATVAATRDSKGRIKNAKFVAAVLALRMEGFTLIETAKILGVSNAKVQNTLTRIRRDSTIPEQLDRLDKIGAALAVDNVLKGIVAGDKDYTMKFMDGRGLFRSHKSVQAEVRQTVLELRVTVDTPTLPAHRDPKQVGSASTTPALPAATISPLTGVVGNLAASIDAMKPKEGA